MDPAATTHQAALQTPPPAAPTRPPTGPDEPPSLPRLSARTQRFRLGVPRTFTVDPTGQRVVFVRSSSGTDRVHALWALDLDSGQERCVADPRTLLDPAVTEELGPQERALRERLRETGAGVVGYSTDTAVRSAAFVLSGELYVADLVGDAGVRRIATPGGVLDPQLDPAGRMVAYACRGALRVVGVDGAGDRALAEPDEPTVVWGLAEFVAAEELDRSRGHWWSRDGSALLVERYDEAPVGTWWIADPAAPGHPPAQVRYPAAGTPNADVSLWLVGLDGERTRVSWDQGRFEYVGAVTCSSDGLPLLRVLSRDQRRAQVLEVAPSGSTSVVAEESDRHWLEVVRGVPVRLPGGAVVGLVDDAGADSRRLAVDGVPVSPPGLQVLEVLDCDDGGVLVVAATEPTAREVVTVGLDGALRSLAGGGGVHAAAGRPGCAVVVSYGLDRAQPSVRVVRPGAPDVPITVLAEPAPYLPSVELLHAGPREVRTAVLLPRGHEPGAGRLPVLLSPYGGPHGAQVLRSAHTFLAAQWFADQGFAVVVADGRGTPARGPSWERAVAGDFVGPVLADQVDALHAAAEAHPDLDLERVAIRGWSFGGWLAALAVLERPDVFHAAVAGAPVTEWELYDTAYTERYLGTPQEHPERYAAHSLVSRAARLHRPLLLMHGLADDNVVVAHTLRLSAALLASGRAHRVLPLSGITHMTPREDVAENLLLLEVDFLREALRRPS